MIKKLPQLLVLLAVMLISVPAKAQTEYQNVQVKDLMTYTTPPTTPSAVVNHPLAGKPVRFTAIVVSYPKNSGNASFNSSTGVINRIHVFVVDTNAASTGRDFQSIQIVEGYTGNSPAPPHVGDRIETMQRGEIYTFFGRMEYFEESVQFNVDDLALVDIDALPKYAERYEPLLQPVEINLSDLITRNEAGQWVYDLSKYGKYLSQYVIIRNATISNRLYPNARPYFAVNKGDARIYTADISLRYRNDRSVYKQGFNWRRAASEPNGEGDFVPPNNGSLVDISGFLLVNRFNPDNHSGLNVGGGAANTVFSSFKIVPWDDGIVWLNGEKYVAGQNGFEWNNDLIIKGIAPGFSNFSQVPAQPRPTDSVRVRITILPGAEGRTITSVNLKYRAGNANEVVVPITGVNNVYSYTFPPFQDGTTVSWTIEATQDDGLVGSFGPNVFASLNAIVSIAQIQRTANDLRGPSPFAGSGTSLSSAYVANFLATVVSDSTDGAIVIHDSANPWSGVFLTARANTNTLRKGNRIRVTALKVGETSSNPANGTTFLDEITYTADGNNSNWQNLIPTITTDEFLNDPGNAEKWEGMVVRFNNVAISNRNADGPSSDFGEFQILTTTRPDTITGVARVGVRVNDDVAAANIRAWAAPGRLYPAETNAHVRLGAVISVTGFVYHANGQPKITPRGGRAGITGTNFTQPYRTTSTTTPPVSALAAVAPPATLILTAPDDEFKPAFTSGLTFLGNTLRDFDGGSVRYLWTVTTPADSATFSSPLANVADDQVNGTTAGTFTIKHSVIDNILAGLGVQPGASARLVWTLRATDGVDTVQAATYGSGTSWTMRPIAYSTTITRLTTTSNETGRTFEFALEQNFPNPFNPSTSIRYSIPATGLVKLTVFDMLGRAVAVPVNSIQTAGIYAQTFDASALSSGIYLYRLEHNGRVMTRKMLLVK